VRALQTVIVQGDQWRTVDLGDKIKTPGKVVVPGHFDGKPVSLVPIPDFIEQKAVIAAKAKMDALMAVHDPDVPEDSIHGKRELARMMELELDYLIKLAAIHVPVETRLQSLAAGVLAATYREMSRLQERLGRPVTPKDPLVTKADSGRLAFQRAEKRGPVRRPSDDLASAITAALGKKR
jgi:hypothetical protein